MIFYGILIVIISTIFGQFLRIEIGSGGILFSDIFLPFLSFLWIFKNKNFSCFKNTIKKIKNFPIFWESFFLITLFSISLFLVSTELNLKDFAESGFYLFRYFFLIFFSFIVFDELSSPSKKEKQKIFLYTIFLSGIILALLGFIQLIIYPDFEEMAKIGWDPHKGRLLSTWFDPNFLGGLFSFLLILLFGIFSVFTQHLNITHIKKFFNKQAFFFSLINLIFLTSLILTFSRSALLNFVISLFILGILYFRKIFIIITAILLFILPFSNRAIQRIDDGIQSAISVSQSQPLFLPDPTARLRVENFEEGISILKDNPKNFFTGIGFNTIRLHRTKKIHSSGGFDSSLLNVIVTTGIFGLITFLWFYFSIVIKISQKTEKNLIKKGVKRGFIFSLLGIFAQSFFINSLFFPLFLLYFFGILGYILSKGNS